MTANEALAAALEVANRPITVRMGIRFFNVVLLASFFVTLLGGLAAGMRAYQAVAASRARVDGTQMSAGLLGNLARLNDTAGALGSREGPEGPALVLRQELESGTYETRVYLFQGMLMQEYAIAERDIDPQSAIGLFPTETFGFKLESGLLRITTDEGELCVAFRSAQSEVGAP